MTKLVFLKLKFKLQDKLIEMISLKTHRLIYNLINIEHFK